MKILFVDQFSEIGGAQQCLLDLLPAVQRKGWCLHAALPGDGRFATRLSAAGVPVVRNPSGPYRSGRKSLRDSVRFAFDQLRQTRVIGGLLSRGRFDLIYVNGPRVLPATARAAGTSVPVLFHAHNRISHGLSLRLLGHGLAACNAHVAACCSFVAAPVRRYIGPGALTVIPNGVPDMSVSTPPADKCGNVLRIGMIGRIEAEKGSLIVLEAACSLAHSGIRTQVVVCGTPSSHSGSYAAQVRTLGASLGVDFLGWQDDVSAVLSTLDLLVIASRNEALPRVMLEAFSAGVPVFAFPVGGIPEVIRNNATGYLVADPTPEALAARIREVLPARSNLTAVARNARALWEDCYNLPLYQDRMIALIESLVQQSAAGQVQ